MNDIDWEAARVVAKEWGRPGAVASPCSNIGRAYLTALEALESEVAGREHDLTAHILGPRMPDRKAHEADGRDW